MDASPQLTLFPLRAPFTAVEYVRLKSASQIPVVDVLRAKSIATNAYLSLIPGYDPKLIEAFEKALAVYSTLLFEPCRAPNPSQTTSNTNSASSVTSFSSFKDASTATHVNQISTQALKRENIDSAVGHAGKHTGVDALDSMDIDLNGSRYEDEDDDYGQNSDGKLEPTTTTTPPNPTAHQQAPQSTNAGMTEYDPTEPTQAGLKVESIASSTLSSVGAISLDDMTQTMWNIFFRQIGDVDLSDATALSSFMEAAENSYYFYVEIFQPAFASSLPVILSPADFLRAILATRMPQALRLLESQGLANNGAHHIAMMDQWITARRQKRVAIAGVVCTDRKKIFLTTGNNNDCWDVPCKVVRDGQSPVEAAQLAAKEGIGLDVILDPTQCVQETIGQVKFYFYMCESLTPKSQIRRMPGRAHCKMGWWQIGAIPDQVLPSTDRQPLSANVPVSTFRIAPFVVAFRNYIRQMPTTEVT